MSEINASVQGPTRYQQFANQNLRSWRPLLTPKYGIMLTFITGIVCLALGLIFYFVLNKAVRFEIRYDNNPDCALNSSCTIKIHVPKTIKGNFDLEYKLTKFYQNSRLYGFSRDDNQLAGDYVDFTGMANCKPWRSRDDNSAPENWILPCGIFALSVFNDTINWDNSGIKFDDSDLLYPVEKNKLFKPLNSKYAAGDQWLNQHNNTIFPGNQTNPHFIVWMRTAFLPTFYKTYAHCKNCELSEGDHEFTILNNYPTTHFKGEKSLAITETTPLGKTQLFLGVSYLVIGSISFVYCIFLVIIRVAMPRKLGQIE